MINNPGDFGSPRGIAHFDALVALGHTLNGRLLATARLSQDCFVPLEAVRPLGQPTVDARGRRAPALRFGDPRVMAVLAAVAQRAHLPAGLANRTLRPQVAALLGLPLSAYSSARMSYDLRRLRLKGLLRRRPKSHAYALTPLGARVAVFFTKLYARCFRPGLAALVPDQPRPARRWPGPRSRRRWPWSAPRSGRPRAWPCRTLALSPCAPSVVRPYPKAGWRPSSASAGSPAAGSAAGSAAPGAGGPTRRGSSASQARAATSRHRPPARSRATATPTV
jgi:hypothetical protein